MAPDVQAFFDDATNTVTYLVADPASGAAAIIDSVLDFDPKSGRTGTASADRIIAAVRARGLSVQWILETHIHADHLSAAPYLQRALGGRTGIGAEVRQTQAIFGRLFNLGSGFATDGRQFDHLFQDGEAAALGGLTVRVLLTPGHTPADVSYVIGDAAFVGDTLFQPDYGSARTDFPGGDAATLYRSVRRLLDLPPETRLFTAHDYKAPGRDHYAWESTVADQRARNIHLRDGVDEAAFVALRRQRDASLDTPRLLLPSVQVNVRAGNLPPPEDNGVRYLKIPLDAL
ncbi:MULTISPECIES: MBL fold metallo-hydrolase [Nitrospirillum]|uniref:Glyoxylase-like metal-dependent hydrolase (Beta-lactamase superfamily II) n=1 Tax=Nitrospirillum amazonense TaxID=28077 RepID=A0A560G1M3_9PROT|nr:MBL fold metallo-hydrolase [Nitrospirillum amazonense]MEC4589445.1 MBL fold metallo-hydrolase [Nitrospirillum amazonense]TWB27749.1 glyoxylase-like metal-dependent hydrolase (beta-lactamase superfamily II) [Nitrospirillum amazonense]